MATEGGEFPEHLANNTLRIYYAMDEAMMRAKKADDDQDEQAEHLATVLLQNADLPLFIRARALMVLGCARSPECVKNAEEAVRIAKLGIELIREDGEEPGEVEERLLRCCEQTLREAQAYLEEGESDGEKSEEASEAATGDIAEQEQQQGLEDEGKDGNEDVAMSAGRPAATGPRSARRRQEQDQKKVPRQITDPERITGPQASPPRMGRRNRQFQVPEEGDEEDSIDQS